MTASFDAERTPDLPARSGATFLGGVPTAVVSMLEKASGGRVNADDQLPVTPSLSI